MHQETPHVLAKKRRLWVWPLPEERGFVSPSGSSRRGASELGGGGNSLARSGGPWIFSFPAVP